jgi:glycosyltransferase involved in cell wall biosynthesis
MMLAGGHELPNVHRPDAHFAAGSEMAPTVPFRTRAPRTGNHLAMSRGLVATGASTEEMMLRVHSTAELPIPEFGGRKLIIQIPCFNEAETLPVTLAALPRALPGIDLIEWLVIDDGSIDCTAEVAREHGVDHVIRLPINQGLARAFVRGLDAAVAAGADIVVNTDADNQYCAEDIPRLIAPILDGEAEIVVGARPISDNPDFSASKKLLQRLGSRVVRRLSGTDVPDAPSGFRAMSRDAAKRLNVFNEYSYTLETIIQAGSKGMAITSVPIRTNPVTRPSRLFRGNAQYIRRQGLTLLRIFMTYNPFQFFAVPGMLSFLVGFAIGLRFMYHFMAGAGEGHVQSLILAALMMGSGLLLVIIGLIADLISVNRKLLERIDGQVRNLEEQIASTLNGEKQAIDRRGT